MFNIIVVDDEINIREGIRDFITGKFPDVNVSGCFEDGMDAINFLKQNNADIVITDIRMLNISGIEVAKYVHENCKGTKVIILSGYREFEYARSAMMYNVKHYLIKPTDLEELSQVMEQTLSELERENEEREHLSSYEKYAYMLKNELLADLLIGAIKDRDVLLSRFELLNTGMNADCCSFGVVNLYIDDYRNYLSENWDYGKDSFNTATKNFIEAQNTPSFFLLHVLNDKACMKFICICPKTSEKELCEIISEHLLKVESFADENLKIHISFETERLYPSVESLLAAGSETDGGQYDEDRIKLLLSHINLKNYREIETLIENYIKSLNEKTPDMLKKACLDIMKTVTDNLECGEISGQHQIDIESAASADEVSLYMKNALVHIAGNVEGPEDGSAVIRKAKEFVDENFGNDISLEDVAEHVFLNPTYFSRYFKQYAGENFTSYLFKKRINYAKKLLDEHFTIEEVAKKCGYSSTKYFTQSFKKHVGKTPKEYRMKA